MPLHNQTKLLKDTAVNTSSQWIDDMNALEESFRDIVEDQRVAFELRMKEIAAKEMRLLKQNEEYIRRDRALREREAALDKMEEYTRNMVAVLLQQPATREQPSQRPENRGDSVYTADKDIDSSSGYITWEKRLQLASGNVIKRQGPDVGKSTIGLCFNQESQSSITKTPR